MTSSLLTRRDLCYLDIARSFPQLGTYGPSTKYLCYIASYYTLHNIYWLYIYLSTLTTDLHLRHNVRLQQRRQSSPPPQPSNCNRHRQQRHLLSPMESRLNLLPNPQRASEDLGPSTRRRSLGLGQRRPARPYQPLDPHPCRRSCEGEY